MVKAEEEVQGLFAQRVGERLAAARKAQGLSLDDVVLRTRVPRRHLEMIEAGNHSALPAIPYSAGFVKTYGQTLGLDGAELARDFRQEVSQVEQVRYVPEPFQPADPARMPSRLKIRNGIGKQILKRVMSPYLPAAVLQKGKQGFSVPLGPWLRTDLRDRKSGV